MSLSSGEVSALDVFLRRPTRMLRRLVDADDCG